MQYTAINAFGLLQVGEETQAVEELRTLLAAIPSPSNIEQLMSYRQNGS